MVTVIIAFLLTIPLVIGILISLSPPLSFLVALCVVILLPILLITLLNAWIDQHFRSALLIPGLEHIARTPLEHTYAAIVTELSQARGETQEATARDLLKQINELIGSARHLEERHADVQRSIGDKSLTALKAEWEDLIRRADTATTPDAQRALRQSADICHGRIEGVQALVALDERLSAQLELVAQTMAAVQVSFARMRNAPEEIAATSLEQIGHTVSGITGQTRAVEQAVEEVMQLSSR